MRAFVQVISIVIFTLASTAASAQERFVIAGLQAPPYVYLDGETRQPSGLLVDLLNETFQTMGLTPEYELSNWARAFMRAQTGDVDAIIPAIKSDDRLEHLIYPVEPLTHLTMTLLQAKNNPLTYSGRVSNLQPYVIGRIRQARVSPELDALMASGHIQYEERNSFRLLALALTANRLDAVAGDTLMALWGASEEGVLDQVSVVQPPLSRIPVYMALTKKSGHAPIEDQFSIALRQAKITLDFEARLRAMQTNHIFGRY